MLGASPLRQLVAGEALLLGLAATVIAVVAGRGGFAHLATGVARATGFLLVVVLLVMAVALAPAVRRAWRRVRGPAFRAAVREYASLPAWYAAPAAFVGGIAAEAVALARMWVDAEASSNSACLAAGVLAALLLAANAAAGA